MSHDFPDFKWLHSLKLTAPTYQTSDSKRKRESLPLPSIFSFENGTFREWKIFSFQPLVFRGTVPKTNKKIPFLHPLVGIKGTFSTCTDGRIQHDGIHRVYGNGISQKDQRLTPEAQLFTGCHGCTKSCEANRELLVGRPTFPWTSGGRIERQG